MPGLVRKLLIFASINGLIVKAHGTTDHQKAIRIDYKTKKIHDYSNDDSSHSGKETQLECHGIIGLLSIASQSFLITITQREQVAQIFGKPVYVITDVAFLPLSTQKDAAKAIATAVYARESDQPSEESDLSESDTDDTPGVDTPDDVASSPPDVYKPGPRRTTSSSSIVQDVIHKKGQFGRFASQWFTKQGWGVGQATGESQTTAIEDNRSNTVHNDAEKPTGLQEPRNEEKQEYEPDASVTKHETIDQMLPKILRTARLVFCSRSYFFSYEFNLTRRLGFMKGNYEPPTKEHLDDLYFWNRHLGKAFTEAHQDSFLMPVIQGFVGQRPFVVSRANRKNSTACIIPVETEGPDVSMAHAISHATKGLSSSDEITQPFLLTVISRRSTKRSGLRYLRRGIDDKGNCANSAETEQILSDPEWSKDRPIRSFTQIRGSIPVYFSQSPYSFKPLPVLQHSASVNEAAMKRHFQDLKSRYGKVQIVVLVDKHRGELTIGEAFENGIKTIREANQLDGVEFEWFDFHAECRGMKFENVSRLVDKLEDKVTGMGETTILNGKVETQQNGVLRINCMDCLDRTNVAESAFAQYMLQKALASEGFEIDLLHDEKTTWFNTLWADNGDAISRQYAGTAALKGDFTRTRKRNYRGALNDFSLTLSRYYNNMVNDFFSQAVIDVLLGNLSWNIFEDFESTMMSTDPGISAGNIRQHAIETCRTLVIQDETEELIDGWTMLAPAQPSTLRTFPFEEVVVLLTDAAVYCCKFDWTTEKLASFEKVDLRCIQKIRFGTYITSTLTDYQMDECFNAGLVIVYQPGKESIIKTNTRSLQNDITPDGNPEANRIDGGTGILSWLATTTTAPTRSVALKVIPRTPSGENSMSSKKDMPLATAKEISDEIKRAMKGPSKLEEESIDLVEQGDIISLAEAKKRTGYIEQISHSLKKMLYA